MRGEAIAWSGFGGAKGSRAGGFINVETYPSGEPLVKLDDRDAEIHKILLRPKNFTEFMGGLAFVDALAARGNPVPDLILPFVPGSRQDRLNDSGDYLFTAKFVAGLINARNFNRVTILDPHSDVISALINNVDVVHAVDCIEYLPKLLETKYDCVVSPDAGAEKRASAVAKKLKLPLIHGWKTRDVSTGAITGFGLENLGEFSHGLVVDDICDGGGTFIGLTGPLFAQMKTADLWTTHGIYSKGTRDLLEYYDNLYCTDSLTNARQDISVANVCEILLNT